MYTYRKLTPAERLELLATRRRAGFPLHAPPHFPDGSRLYLITAACYEHASILESVARRKAFETELLNRLTLESGADIRAWVILPNHYHLLARVDLARLRETLRLVHSACSARWNKEDDMPGRRVWYRFADRAIRSDGHYWATVNYIHANPAKHGHTARADAWETSSLGRYLEQHGRDKMAALWKAHPLLDYGKGWDEQ